LRAGQRPMHVSHSAEQNQSRNELAYSPSIPNLPLLLPPNTIGCRGAKPCSNISRDYDLLSRDELPTPPPLAEHNIEKSGLTKYIVYAPYFETEG
jgi:hypothetical protein